MDNLVKLPEVKFNKNGYEIRSDVLGMANQLLMSEYNYKFHGWEMTQTKDSNGQLVNTVKVPEFPGLDKVLETAEKMYSFVSNGQLKPTSKPAK